MDSQFKVPSIPLVSSNLLTDNRRPEVKRKKSIKSSPSITKQATQSESVPERNPTTRSSGPVSTEDTGKTSNVVRDIFPKRALPKLCPSCSQILIEYLAPIEAYIKQIITLADDRVAKDLVTPMPFNSQANTDSHTNSTQVSTQENERANNEELSWNGSNQIQAQSFTQWSTGSEPPSAGGQAWDQGHNVTNTPTHQYTQSPPQEMPPSGTSGAAFSSSVVENSNSAQPTEKRVDIPIVRSNSQRESQNNAWQGTSNDYRAQEQTNQNQDGRAHNEASSQFVHSTSSEQQYHERKQPNESYETPVVFESAKHVGNDAPSTGNEWHKNEDQREHGNDKPQQSDAPHYRNEYQADTTQTESDTRKLEEVAAESTPYAYVTIAFNNLSAVNAILLACSIRLYNNQSLLVLENDASLNKKIHTRYYVPMVILLYGSINNQLRGILYQVFDKVIESKYHDAVLLNDESLGIQQYKMHMWKELAFQYEKCLFLDAFTLVVGEVSNLFLECQELSACVDILLPDNFDCSVFVFEPNMDTFRNLLNYGMQLQLEVEETYDTLDEMTLLNRFFASKWKKLSFIYNFVRNDLSYTQVPAYFKFGGNIRVANFGNLVGQHDQMSSAQQPWNYKFDISKAQLEQEPFEFAPVDGFTKFYLRCFMRRVWPLLSQTISPYLLSRHHGRTEWNIFELVQVLSRVDGTEDAGLDQNPGTLRRKKSWVASFVEQMNQPESSVQLSDSEDGNTEQQQQNEQQTEQQAEEQAEQKAEPQETAEDNTSEEAEVTSTDAEEIEDRPELTASQTKIQNERVRKEWEEGKVDWMGQQRSDNIIDRLKSRFS